MAVLAKILLEEAPRAARAGAATCRAALDELVARMLAKEPAERPRDGAGGGSTRSTSSGAIADAAAPAPRRHDACAAALTGERAAPRVRRCWPAVAQRRRRRGRPAPTPPTATRADDAAPTRRAEIEALETELASAHGARVHALADGSVVVTLAGAGDGDRSGGAGGALRAALRGALPDAADGAGDRARRWSPAASAGRRGDRSRRARSCACARAGARSALDDDVTAGLLDARFEVGGDGSRRSSCAASATSTRPRARCSASPRRASGASASSAMLTGLFSQRGVDEPVARAVLVTGAGGRRQVAPAPRAARAGCSGAASALEVLDRRAAIR